MRYVVSELNEKKKRLREPKVENVAEKKNVRSGLSWRFLSSILLCVATLDSETRPELIASSLRFRFTVVNIGTPRLSIAILPTREL